MAKGTISEALDRIAARYSDGRLNVFELTAEMPSPDRCLLSGMVLNRETLDHTMQELATVFPEITFDTDEIVVLRKTPAQNLTISTNLAGFHRHPSRATELLSQVLNGTIVELLRKDDSWSFVRQQDGYLGWVQSAYLTSDLPEAAPTHMVYEPVVHVLAGPDEQEKIVSRVFAGTAVHVSATADSWVRIDLVGGRSGWVPANTLRSLDSLPQTTEEQCSLMGSIAAAFIGVPYCWGGCTVCGIDCSGFVQLLHRLAGVTLPRDADMQYAAGIPIEPPLQIGDLLYFGGESGHRAITHVGMSLGGWRMIHSSGSRNGVYEDDVQEISWLRDAFVGANTFLNTYDAD